MPADYLIVGPTCELRSASDPQFSAAGATLVNSLQITRGDRACGSALAELRDGQVLLHIQADPPDDVLAAEAFRLLARVAARQTDHALPLAAPSPRSDAMAAALREDGFLAGPHGRWQRPPGLFLRPDQVKLEHNYDVYKDPYCVPWNFVPREWDVMARLVADHRGPPRISRPGQPPAAMPTVRVLDLGCGYGKNAMALEHLGLITHGIDYSPLAIARCRRIVKNPSRFMVASAACLPFADGSFDCVMDVGCLHCLGDAERPRAVAEIARILTPTGRLYSRSFKPRPAEWRNRMPFRTTTFGLSPEQMIALLAGHFTATIWQPHDDHNYVLARRTG
mgnify:CR=1 FL=1